MTKVLVLKSFSGDKYHAGRGKTIDMDHANALSLHKAGIVHIIEQDGKPTAYETAEDALGKTEKKVIKPKKGKK